MMQIDIANSQNNAKSFATQFQQGNSNSEGRIRKGNGENMGKGRRMIWKRLKSKRMLLKITFHCG